MSHVDPEYPLAHAHVAVPSSPIEHVPPFEHGFGSHTDIWHVLPENPLGHVQTADPSDPIAHDPPFIQGLGSQTEVWHV